MPDFTGQLATNKMFASLYNQVISIQVFGTGVELDDSLYGKRKVDGTLYGDKKLFISTDVIDTYAWEHENAPSYNLLTKKRPPAPKEQYIAINVFRQIPLTVDEYLTKQAFSDEGSFGQFNGTLLAWLGKTKEVYEHTKFLTDLIVGGSAGATSLGSVSITNAGITEADALIRWQAQEIFRGLEDSIAELGEPSRDYNDNGFLRTAKLQDFDIVAPLGVLSNVKKHDIPYLFSPDEKPNIVEVHWKYFGTVIDIVTASTAGTERAMYEQDVTVGGVTTHLRAGDLIPLGVANLPAYAAYAPKYSSRPTIADGVDLLLIHKDDFPIMSAFSVGTSFFNAQDLTTNHYLTFGHSDVQDSHLAEFPLLKYSITS